MNEIRDMIDKIAANVDDVKKKQSTILSAPHTDDSKCWLITSIGDLGYQGFLI